jgi:glyoxylase-like metal-dependent hydrolase (beta-lactamase superfamily II)
MLSTWIKTGLTQRRGVILLQIYTIPVTPFSQNARVLFEPQSGNAVIVDPGGDIEQILSVVRELNPASLRILLTHGHIDHAGGVAKCLEDAASQFGLAIPLLAHADPLLRTTIARQAKLFGLSASEYQNAPEPDIVLDEGDKFAIGTIEATVSWVPGHAPDHLTLFFDVPEFELHEDSSARTMYAPVLLAGDTLFAGSIGRTDLPGGSLPLLLKGIHEKLLVLPEDTVVLCGHGPSTTIGEEKQFNPFLQD